MSEFKFINPMDKPERYMQNDLGSGYLFADTFKYKARFVWDAKKWYYYDGTVWKEDNSKVFVNEMAKDLIKYIDSLCVEEFADYLAEMFKQRSRKVMISEAESVDPISITDFDKDKNLLNCLNCTIDLSTFESREHNPKDFITKKANFYYKPEAEYKRWEQFISEVMNNDKEMIGYFQKILGCTLTGESKEECFFILYGPKTRNGKGTTMETIKYILGGYSTVLQPRSLTDKNGNASKPSVDIADLAGARFVSVSELEAGLTINSVKIKQWTGRDTIKARFLYGNPFEFEPQFKLFISTNCLPEILDDTLFAAIE